MGPVHPSSCLIRFFNLSTVFFCCLLLGIKIQPNRINPISQQSCMERLESTFKTSFNSCNHPHLLAFDLKLPNCYRVTVIHSAPHVRPMHVFFVKCQSCSRSMLLKIKLLLPRKKQIKWYKPGNKTGILETLTRKKMKYGNREKNKQEERER